MKNKINAKRKCAFTLAEVLITLGIIGVVAAMTIPTLIANYQKTQTVNRLKKAYSMMSQAIRASIESEEENGECLSLQKDATYSYEDLVEHEKNFVEKCLAPHLKISKICAPSSDDCWKNGSTNITGDTKTVAQNGTGWSKSCVSFVLTNGDSVYMWMGQPTAEWSAHLKLLYDIDGMNSGKSMLGKDLFLMKVDNNHNLTLYGNTRTREALIHHESDKFGCTKEGSKGSASAGYYCGALIQKDGWTISKDYPW